MAQRRTKQEQRREVEGWRRSGQSATGYAASRGYATSTLLRWSAAEREDEARGEPRFVRLQVEPVEEPVAELVVEMGSARVRVARGFDPVLLRAVIAALGAPEAT